MVEIKVMPLFRKNKKELLILSAILLIAAFLRLYLLDSYMQFLGDQGRDAIIVKDILTGKNFPAIGPPMSVGTVYLGPLYYYMMAFSMAIFWLNPVAAAAMCALLGVASVGIIYYLSREWFGKIAAVTAALLYAFSPVAINYSRFSWNPNPVPFFSLLTILGLWLSHKSGNFWFFVLTGFGLAASIQMHYLALILLPIVGLLWVYEFSLVWRKKLKVKNFWLGTISAVVVFILMMVPLILFDLKHDYLNYRGLVDLFFGSGGDVKLSLVDSANRLPWVYGNSFIGRYIGGQISLLTLIISLAVFIPIIYGVREKIRGEAMHWSILALSVWLFVGFFGLMFYKRDIYDHYLAFVSPVPFILMGGLFALISAKLKKQKWTFWVLGASLIIVLSANFMQNPLRYPPNNQLERTQNISRFVIKAAEGKPYNFALIAENNYDSAYQYYLDMFGHQPKNLPDLPYEKTDQLFVVCEENDCRPVGHSKQEIAAFGWTMVEWEREAEGLKIFKLVPNPAQGKR